MPGSYVGVGHARLGRESGLLYLVLCLSRLFGLPLHVGWSVRAPPRLSGFSTRWLWKPQHVSAAIQYVVAEQSDAMSLFADDEPE